MKNRLLVATSCFAAALLAIPIGAALAQAYPVRAVRMVVPFPAGGATDIVGRLVAQKLSEAWGQQVIVDNRGGAGGTIGSDMVAKSAPDGYTILVATSSTHAIAPSLYSKLTYDPVRDFTPVTLLASATILLAVHPSVPAKNVRELIALGKRQPRALSFASSGNGGISHLIGEQCKSMGGIEMLHVPYKGDTPALVDLVSGQVSLMFGTAVSFLPYVKSGRLNALAVTNPKRSPIVPDVPTVAESGLPGFEALQWFGIFAPAGTSKDVIARQNGEIVKILRLPDVRERLSSLGADVVGNTPEQFAAFQKADAAKWARIVKQSGAKID
ncbi:MAG: tripartite tricarboxylate transporter substrate binding protein [Betaproteobacteria bacterium]|nr:tripartite tricarboxylate transporter substrate binding protein [Betaproteobacteria bacterium]